MDMEGKDMYMGAYASANALNCYKNDSVMMARPIELVIMLYDGLIKKIKLAKLYIGDGEIEQAHNSLVRAQDIVGELLHSLNFNYEVADNLMKLYEFIIVELAEANMDKDVARLDGVLGIIEELRNTWHAIRNEGGHMYSIEE